jgi:hypothetical protein
MTNPSLGVCALTTLLCNFELCEPFDQHQEQNARLIAGRFFFSSGLCRCEETFFSQSLLAF